MAKYLDKDGLELYHANITEVIADGDTYSPSQSLQENEDLRSKVIGGLASQTAKDLADKQYTMSELFDEILFPTENPTITRPSIVWKNFSSKNVLVGSDIADQLVTESNVSAKTTISLGSWSLSSNNGMSASNGHGDITLTTNAPDNGKMPATSVTFSASVVCNAGNDPKNNKGQVVEGLGYAGGTISTSVVTWSPYYDWYATSGEVFAGMVTQPLLANCGISTVTTPGVLIAPHDQDDESKHVKFKIPRQLQRFEQLNTLSGNFEQIDWVNAGWVETIDGTTTNGINYYTYEYTDKTNGSITIKLTF